MIDFMSTTITPAFRLSSEIDVFTVADGLRGTLIPYLADKFRKEAVAMAVREFDNGNEVPGLEFSEFLKKFIILLRENLTGHSEKYDKYDLLPFKRILDCQAVFLRNKVRNETYCLISQDGLGEKGETLVLNEVKGIESDFSYWNGTDSQVAVIGEDEWYFRKACWKETIDRSVGIPQQGLVVRFFETLSLYELLNWKFFEGKSESLLAEEVEEERFRRIVFNTFLGKLRKVYPDFDIMEMVNGSWHFLNPRKARDYEKLPFFEEQKMRLDDAILFAETRVTDFPLRF